MVGIVLAFPFWGVVVLVVMLVGHEPKGMSEPILASAAVVVEGADATERAKRVESAVGAERAEAYASAETEERAVSAEGAGATVRAAAYESADESERVDVREGAAKVQRAVAAEGAVGTERADAHEGAAKSERAATAERADDNARAGANESAERDERPRLKTGYPQIMSSSHALWDDQQAGWPDHLPHQAWRATAYTQSRDEAFQKVSSADHPAFGESYVPNYAATPEAPSADYIAHRQGKARR